MDSDALIKLTKCKAKEPVLSYIDVCIPETVVHEVVDEGVELGFPDAVEIRKNLESGKLKVVKSTSRNARVVANALQLRGGEVDVYALYVEGGFDAVASDNQKFIRRLEGLGVNFVTPAAIITYIWMMERIDAESALDLLEALRPLVSKEEYLLSKNEIERKAGH